MPSLHDCKTVIVTGGAGGLGLSIAHSFLSEGANVVVTDIDPSRLSSCSDTVKDTSEKSRFLPLRIDGTDPEAVESLFDHAIERFGRVDVLINNAAVNDKLEPVGECSMGMWERNLKVNLTAPFISCQEAVKRMLAQEPKGGVILNVISAGGVFGHRAGVAYTASKHGLVGLTKNTAAFYGPKGIRCLAILPGPMRTGMVHDASQYHQEGMALVGRTFASMEHFGWNSLEEVARTVVLLCSDGIGTVNGTLVSTDNGWTTL